MTRELEQAQRRICAPIDDVLLKLEKRGAELQTIIGGRSIDGCNCKHCKRTDEMTSCEAAKADKIPHCGGCDKGE